MSTTDSVTPQENPSAEQPSAVQESIQELTLRVPFPDSFVYSNAAAFSISLMDIRISFAEAMPDRTVQPRVGLVMAPEQAAILAITLLLQLDSYEKNFGQIRDPRWRDFAALSSKYYEHLQQQRLGADPAAKTPPEEKPEVS